MDTTPLLSHLFLCSAGIEPGPHVPGRPLPLSHTPALGTEFCHALQSSSYPCPRQCAGVGLPFVTNTALSRVRKQCSRLAHPLWLTGDCTGVTEQGRRLPELWALEAGKSRAWRCILSASKAGLCGHLRRASRGKPQRASSGLSSSSHGPVSGQGPAQGRVNPTCLHGPPQQVMA